MLLAFINNGGNSTRRIYELHTGRQFGEVLQREGNYRQAFPEDLTDTALRLNGHWDETEIDEWGSEIPSNVLDLAAERSASHTARAQGESQAFRRCGGTVCGAVDFECREPRVRFATFFRQSFLTEILTEIPLR